VAPNGLATAAINTRFLQIRGVPLPAALASLFLNTAGSAVAEVVLFVAVLPVAGSTIDLSLIPWRGLLAGGIALGSVVAVIGAAIWRVPQLRRFVAGHVRPALDHLHAVLNSPTKLGLVVGGQALVQLLYAAALGAVCFAFGASVPFGTLLLVNIGTSVLSGLLPMPGGLGVGEAALAGALAATGLSPASAISIALTQRMITTWLPSVPGWIALRALERGDDL
jgi:uncharacterized membrane protein YbhN (UPF0104 family)